MKYQKSTSIFFFNWLQLIPFTPLDTIKDFYQYEKVRQLTENWEKKHTVFANCMGDTRKSGKNQILFDDKNQIFKWVPIRNDRNPSNPSSPLINSFSFIRQIHVSTNRLLTIEGESEKKKYQIYAMTEQYAKQ